ncbi:hypothetical protein G647_06126 [Cladophialophora carrionii CBS 160.54]|uniref:BPL/LPL catalytic domain-containing protein n=1 Tax=Cladophialophora carrionii CBS 160.54 TaxID=1279043 RepID=V9D5A6_9EURO|nr:uncharacterized protein G647_06126 [Cladophialophora carrionii CBS 160.54]ETI22055.1 hypothetical protein G647_06126 [Cladophialophora carrionii CBS 160.54]
MRLAHLHILGLIPYSHSLRLQNATIERHFRHKDLLRRSAAAVGAAPGHDAQSGVSSKIHAFVPEEKHAVREDLSDARKQNALTGPASWTSNAVKLQPNVAEASHDQPRTSMLQPGSGSCTTASSSTSNQRLGFQNRQHDDTGPPDPVLLTFSTPPTYTVGRRHLLTNPISPEQQYFLSANGLATFHASPRGGLLTYHAPGQVTGYVIADLRRHGITARCWVRLLEESVIRTCRAWGVRTARTNDPGVWALSRERESEQTRSPGEDGQTGQTREPQASDRKICAIGVQVSRGITSHGIGLNVHDAPLGLLPSSSHPQQGEMNNFTFTPAQLCSPSYDPVTKGHLSWGFSRIVACGLEGKSVTWLTREMGSSDPALARSSSSTQPFPPPTEEAVATILAREIMNGLNTMKGADKEAVDGIYRIQQADVLT